MPTPGQMAAQAGTIVRRVYPAQPRGRPVSNIGRYLLKPTDTTDTGSEFINTKPSVIQKVEKEQLKKGELPPALQPKYLRKPEVLDKPRQKAISKGFVNPRARM